MLLTNKVINEKSLSVEHGECVKSLVSDMLTILEAKGIGLAAVQIGVLKRVIIVKINGEFVVMINPVITHKSTDKKQSREGCLSFPNFEVKKQRHYRVTVEFENEQREKAQVKLSALAAFCVQHEIDHLEGVTIN
jgi:peptide deformylase